MNINDYTANLEYKDGIYFSTNQKAVSYPEEGNMDYYNIEDSSFWFVHRNNCISAVVKQYNQTRLMLDIGGGNGFVTKGLENADLPVILLEPGLSGCLNAKKRGIKNIICSSLEDAEFYNNSIPSAGMFDVIEHIEDEKHFLQIVRDLIQPDGNIYITVPAYKSLWSHEDVYAGHFRRYSLKEIEDTLKNAGFSITYSTYIFSVLPVAVFLFRVIPYLFGRKNRERRTQDLTQTHTVQRNFFQKILQWIWSKELDFINSGRTIPFGGSCLVVAKKLKQG